MFNENDTEDIVKSFRAKQKSLDSWRALLMVTPEDVSLMDASMQQLKHIGVDQIHVCAQAKTRISNRYEHSLHQRASWDSPYRLWKEALADFGNVYTSQSSLFLIVRPGVYLWEQLLTYCEYQIPRDRLGVWCPLTPNRVFPSSSIVRPRCDGEWGWCPTQTTPDIEMYHCFVMTGHMMTLLSSYMPDVDEPQHVGSTLAYECSRRHIPYYFHDPSLGSYEPDVNFSATDFVGMWFHMSQKEMRQQRFIMNSKAR